MTRTLPRWLLALLVPAYAIFLFAPATGYMHDDGLYIVTAKSLVEGKGYRIESLPEPLVQTKYSFLFPAVLAPILKVSAQTILLKLPAFLMTAGWLFAVYRLSSGSWWIVFFTACSPWVIFLGTAALPDTGFALASTAAVLLVERKEVRMSRVAGGAALAAAAFLIRATGIALIVAIVAILLKQRKWRELILFLGIVAVVCAPWMLWQSAHPAPSDPVEQYYTKASYQRGHIFGNYKPIEALTVIGLNALFIASSFTTLLGLSLSPIGYALSFVVSALALTGLYRSLRDCLNVMNLWALLYLGILLCWAWPSHRYLTPLVPVILIFAGTPLERLKKVAIPIVLLCSVLGIVFVARASHETWRRGTPPLPSAKADDWRLTNELAAWIRDNTPVDAVLSATLDPMFYMLTGRKSIRPFAADPYLLFYGSGERPIGDAENLRAHLGRHHVTYVVMTPCDGFGEMPHLRRLIDELTAAGTLRPVKKLDEPGYAIYQVRP